MSKCQIQWIDKFGNATPDNNESVALIQQLGTIDMKSNRRGEPSELYHCCENHLKQMEGFTPKICWGYLKDLGWRIVEDIRANTRD